MSEWNLSVRLTGQGSDLARTLRNLSRDAGNASRNVQALRRDLSRLRTEARTPIRVRLDVDAAHLRSDIRAALSTAGTGQNLSVRLDVDARNLRTQAQAAVRAASSGLSMTADLNLNTRGLTRLRAGSRDAAHSLNTLQRAAREAKNELEELEGRALTTAAAIRRINTAAGRARGRLDDMSTSTRTFRTDLDDLDGSLTRVGGSLTGLRGRVGGLTSSSGSGSGLGQLGLHTLITLAPAAIPLLAGLTASAAPLAGTLTAAGGAATAFGIALAGQIGPLSDVADAETKYQEAVREHGKSSAEAMEAQLKYQQILAELPPEAQQAAIALSSLKETFSDWSDDMAQFTMEPVSKSFALIEELLPHLSPQVESFSDHLNRLLDVAGGAVTTPGFDAFSDRVAALTDAKLDDFTDQLIHLMRVVSQGDADAGLLGQILDYMRANGPAAREALNAIGDAVGNLIEAASIAGPSMLTLVTAAANLVAALPPELVAIILQTAAALKLLQLSGAGFAMLAGGIAAVRTQILTLAAASTAAGGGLAGLRAAFLALGTAAKASVILAGLGALVYAVSELSDIGEQAPPNVDKLTTALGKLGATGKVTGEAASAFGKDFGKLKDQIDKVLNPSTVDSINNWGADITDGFLDASDSTEEFTKSMDSIDESLTNLVQGGKADLAAAALENMLKGMSPEQAEKFKSELDGYNSALEDLKFEQELAAQSSGIFGSAVQETSAKLEAQKASADGLRQSILALNEVNRAAGSAMSAFEQSIDDATKAVKKHGSALKVRDGELDLGSQKARDAEKVLSELAANTDAAAAAAREQGKSWEHVTSIQERGRQAFIDAADAMGLSKAQAEALADSYLAIPDKKTLSVEMRTEDAIAGLDAVIAEIEKTPDAKSVTVKALTADAQSMLRGLGFEVEQLKDGSFKVTASTATAQDALAKVQSQRDGLADKTITIDARTQDTINSLQGVQDKVATTKGKTITMKAPTDAARHQLELLGFKIRDTKGKNVVISVPTGSQRANVSALASSIAALRDKSVTITTNYVITGNQARRSGSHGSQLANAQGGVWDYYANGGIRGGRGGRVSFYAGGGMEPGDRPNQHVAQIAPAGSYRVWAERETSGEGYVPFRRSARPRSRAITEEIVHRLGGDPTTIQWNADGNVTDWRYDPATGSLYSPSDAGSAGNKTKKVKGKEVSYFDLGAVERKLWSMSRSTAAYNRNLEKVADLAGGDVAQALASMGKEGEALAKKMANGSKKYIAQMSIALRGLSQTARASLTDYKFQLEGAIGEQDVFTKNLAKLSAQGYGDLAGQLAAQNDQAARELAAAAVRDKKKAAGANSAAKRANNALTPDQVQALVSIIAAIRTKTTGIHDVAASTGLGEDEIITVGNKAKSQISSSLGSRATRFLSDLGKANKHQAYADGGIRAGLYATRGGIIRFAEPETHGEAFLPLAPSKRRSALPVLADVATRFGLGLTDARATRPVVIVRESSPTNVTVTAVRTGATASDIGAQVGRSVRRARRGGVASRAA